MKILIIRFSSIGDIVLTSAVVRGVKQQVPSAELHFLTKPSFAPLLQHNPYVDKLYTLQSSLWGTAQLLRREHYDQVVDLHCNLRSHVLRLLLCCKSTGFDKEDGARRRYVRTKLFAGTGLHVVDRYFGAVRSLQVRNDGRGLDLFMPTAADKTALEQLLPGAPYVAIVCGAQHYTKQIPIDRLHFLCENLHLPVVLVGGKTEQELLQQEDWTAQGQVFNLCGCTGLSDSARIIGRAAVVITPDTGMMHIAAALRRPVIAIWGCTTPQMGFAPYGTEAVNLEVQALKCRPCSRFGLERCPLQHYDCMQKQDWAHVVTLCRSMYAQSVEATQNR
ncbi:MAG: glycosyltransferase family 9 protein [Bacteroidales bacterium]|nr:glycosyltransferase family 9 protein [Bacteroidales bacterium]